MRVLTVCCGRRDCESGQERTTKTCSLCHRRHPGRLKQCSSSRTSPPLPCSALLSSTLLRSALPCPALPCHAMLGQPNATKAAQWPTFACIWASTHPHNPPVDCSSVLSSTCPHPTSTPWPTAKGRPVVSAARRQSERQTTDGLAWSSLAWPGLTATKPRQSRQSRQSMTITDHHPSPAGRSKPGQGRGR